MTWSYALAALLLPPVGPMALAFILIAWRPGSGHGAMPDRKGRVRVRRAGIAAAALLMFDLLLALPIVANAIARWSEPPVLDETQLATAQAIVILGGGRNLGALEWGGETLDPESLQRLRYGAALARRAGLPILVSGGQPTGGHHSEASLMAGILREDYGLQARWEEGESRTTAENASLSGPPLRAAGIRRIVLVTSAFHLPRAQRAFARQGFAVVPAPCAYAGFLPPDADWRQQWILTPTALILSERMIAENLARAWYRIRGD